MSSSSRPPLTGEQLVELVELYQRRLGLEHWRIEVDLETPPADPASSAEVDRFLDYPTARIRFNAAWPVTPADRWGDFGLSIDEIVAHELAHLLLQPIDRVVDHTFEQLGGQAGAIAAAAYKSALEQSVDAVARVLVEAYAPADAAAPER